MVGTQGCPRTDLHQGDGGSDDTGSDDAGDTGEPGLDLSDRDRVVCDVTASRGRCTLRFPTAEESPVFRPGISFDAVVPSWNAETPAGSWIEVALQAQVDGSWTEWAGGFCAAAVVTGLWCHCCGDGGVVTGLW